ncbi:hypothetical protein BH18ACI1_BH18ACI1_23180 [soil metagenome]
MKLPQFKKRNGKMFELVNDFHSKLDAQKEIKKIRNENSFFGKKKSFIFCSKHSEVTLSYGIYEQVFYVN